MVKKESQPAYIKEIIKKHGNIILTGNQLLDQKKDYKMISVSPAIDIALNGGIKEGTWLLLSGPPKSGKAQPLSSLVYTPSGPKPMGDIQVGDWVCTPHCESTRVVGVYPQGMRPVFKFNFSDGTSCKCDREHLWKVQNTSSGKFYIKTAEELFNNQRFSDRRKWRLPHVHVMHFNNIDHVIHPYLLGVLLHSGSITKDGRLSVKLNSETRGRFISLWAEKYGETPNLGIKPVRCEQFLEDLDSINLELNKYRNIPDQYRYSDFIQRMELLFAYMASANNSKNLPIHTLRMPNAQFAHNMFEMAKTLGIYCKLVYMHDKPYIKVRMLPYNDTSTPLWHKEIVSIEEAGEELCQCIKVESKDELYVTDGITATHNTTTAMQLAYQCQQEGRPIIYVNSEGRLNDLNFEVEGLDPEKMIIITAEDSPISAETFLDVVHKLISVPENHGALCIIDSISSLIPQKDLEEEVTGSTRPGLPKILSNFVKKCGQIVPNNKTIMCMITHMIANTSGYGKSSMSDGGVKIQYQADTRMEVKSVTPWTTSDKKTKIGQAVKWTIYYSGLGARNYECDSWLRYGKGIDKLQEILIIALELGFISQAGAWITCDFLYANPQLLNQINPDVLLNDDLTYTNEDDALKACKVNGQEKLYKFFTDHPDLYDYLYTQIKSVLV